jgi:hypothetical protein
MCSKEKAIENAAASVEMEGFKVDKETKEMCAKLLSGEMTFEEYLAISLKSVGAM